MVEVPLVFYTKSVKALPQQTNLNEQIKCDARLLDFSNVLKHMPDKTDIIPFN